jgi:hypothetical protein
MNRIRISFVGVSLSVAYVLLSAFCLWSSASPNGDPKGAFVLLQAPVALQMALLQGAGLTEILEGVGWAEAYIFLGLPLLVLLYFLGTCLESVIVKVSRIMRWQEKRK